MVSTLQKGTLPPRPRNTSQIVLIQNSYTFSVCFTLPGRGLSTSLSLTKGSIYKLLCKCKCLSHIESMLKLHTGFKFECLKCSHGSSSEHTGFPHAGALPGATFLSGREAVVFLVCCTKLPLGKLF